ncbi:MAG: molybdopterin-synthase adenylyltransferase MoeB [Acidobacteria bacterium]|nr:molybdopterin-synthase adenylyltransferase MoeB [Acidobacteriota bacterium]MBA3888772.1 molybdopterin-synthase adenylyltransferase MoeB [Acidobacteriota bacterium]
MSLPELTAEEARRYSRHLSLPEVGVEGQRRLKAARVLCIGAGGLGSPASLYLAAAGVGTIGLVDFDAVDITNLHRQVLYTTADVGRPKLDAARDRLQALNPGLILELHHDPFGIRNARELIGAYDVVLDGTDNFPARYLVNDACVLVGRPNAYGSIFRFEGQASVFAAAGGPCYRCLHPEPPPPGLVPSCAEGGVLGVLPGIIGTIQATEAIKLLLGIGEPLVGRFVIYDALRMRFRELTLRKDPDCPVCGTRPSIRELEELADYCTPARGHDEETMTADEMTVLGLKARMDAGNPPRLIDVREPHEYQICSIPGATLIPMSQIPDRLGEFDRSAELVVHCRSGARSAQVVAFLRQKGFTDAHNLAGGVLAWIDQVDPSQPKY